MSKGPNELFYDIFSASTGIAIFIGGPIGVVLGAIAGGLGYAGYEAIAKPIGGLAIFFGIISMAAFVFLQFIDFDKMKRSAEKERQEMAKAKP